MINLLKLSNVKEVIIVLAVWELVWKGIALWKAARNNKKYWFIALLVVNSIGILPILYIYIFSKSRNAKLSHSRND